MPPYNLDATPDCPNPAEDPREPQQYSDPSGPEGETEPRTFEPPRIPHPIVSLSDAYFSGASRKLDAFLAKTVPLIIVLFSISELEKIPRLLDTETLFLLPGGKIVSKSSRPWIALHLATCFAIELLLLFRQLEMKSRNLPVMHAFFGLVLAFNITVLGSLPAFEAIVTTSCFYFGLTFLLIEGYANGVGIGYYTVLFPLPMYQTLLTKFFG